MRDNMIRRVQHKYTKESIFTTPFEIFYQRWILQRKLVVDIYLKPGELGGKDYYRQEEYWTNEDSDDIHAKGYLDAVGLHDSIFWTWTNIYVRIHNAVEFPIAEIYPAKKDTAYTINDSALSRAVEKFKRAMSRVQLTQSADWQKLGLIAVLGVGVVIGTKILGFW